MVLAAHGFKVLAAHGFKVLAAHGFKVLAAHGFKVLAAHGFSVLAAQGLIVLAAQGLIVLAAQGLIVLAAQGFRVLAAQGFSVLAAQGFSVLAAQGLIVLAAHGFTARSVAAPGPVNTKTELTTRTTTNPPPASNISGRTIFLNMVFSSFLNVIHLALEPRWIKKASTPLCKISREWLTLIYHLSPSVGLTSQEALSMMGEALLI